MIRYITFLLVVVLTFLGDKKAVKAGPVALKEFIWHDGFICPTNFTVFTKIGTFRLEVCLLKCRNDPTCFGIKYEPFRLQCTGCQWYSPPVVPLVQTPGLEHYSLHSKYVACSMFNFDGFVIYNNFQSI